jgi:hypothetical protein
VLAASPFTLAEGTIMKLRILFSVIIGIVITLSLSPLKATDWPTSECITDGKFDKHKCSQRASWVAVGTGKDFRLLSYPPVNPLTEFTLQVKTWEKGTNRIKKRKEIKFLEGYFSHSAQPGCLIRVYGYQKVKHLPEKEYGVFFIEELDEKK